MGTFTASVEKARYADWRRPTLRDDDNTAVAHCATMTRCADDTKEIEPVARLLGESVKEVQAKIAALQESNPMLGFRGCRIALLYPQGPEMQVRAVFG